MMILAFDLATTAGVAVGDARDKPTASTVRFGKPRSSHGARFLQAILTAKALIREHEPDMVGLEMAIATGVRGGAERAQLAMGLRASVLSACFAADVPACEWAVQTIRKHFIGDGNLRRAKAKAAVWERCRQLGWHAENDNESDACAVWEYTRAVKARIMVPAKGSLFSP